MFKKVELFISSKITAYFQKNFRLYIMGVKKMLTLDVNDGVEINNSDQEKQYTFLNVELDNDYENPLSLDVLFFTSPVTMSNERFYRMFVRLNFKDGKYVNHLGEKDENGDGKINDDDKTIQIFGDTSKVSFEFMKKNSATKLKTLEGEDELKFGSMKFGNKYVLNSKDQAYMPKFYGIKIPYDYFQWGQLNKIRFDASINSSAKSAAQKFHGIIWINGLNEFKVNKDGDNRILIDRSNQVEAFINGIPSIDEGYGYLNAMHSSYIVDNLSTYENNRFYEHYIITKKTFYGSIDHLNFDEAMKGYLKNELVGISDLEDFDIESHMRLEDDSAKLSDFYNIEKQHNGIVQIKPRVFEVTNTDSTFLDPNDGQVKNSVQGDKGIYINPAYSKGMLFENEIDLVGWKLKITNEIKSSVVATDISYSHDDFQLDNLAVSYEIDVNSDELAAYKIEDIEGYIEKHEKVL
jgi:hypothetical protein